jgi:hypothetical protein
MTFDEIFEANFPKLCERPAMHAYKDDIREICKRMFLAAKHTMPWDEEL